MRCERTRRLLAPFPRACLDRNIVFSFPPLTPVVKKLIIALFSAFVIELLLENFAGLPVSALLSLDPVHLGPLSLLQIFTYVVIEDPRGVMSMLIGLFFMWLILSPFESAFGRKHTLELMLAGTLGAAFAVIAIAQVAGIPGYRLYGSYPIAYAGMAAMTQVMRGGRMLFFGVLPMTSRQLLLVLAGLSLLQFLASRDHLTLAGSLGAMIAGAGYVRYMARAPRPSQPKRSPNTRLRVVRGGGSGSGSRDDGDSDRPKWLN
jgi:membrane associated rhomboid family serine protease